LVYINSSLSKTLWETDAICYFTSGLFFYFD
jgi:hypothetical protein